MHGEIMKALCGACGHRWGWSGEMSRADTCPACATKGQVRPDVVWFGEMPYAMDTIAAALDSATLFVAIGTSGAVYPAAGFVAEARARGVETLEINLEPSEVAGQFDRQRLGPATETVPDFVQQILRG